MNSNSKIMKIVEEEEEGSEHVAELNIRNNPNKSKFKSRLSRVSFSIPNEENDDENKNVQGNEIKNISEENDKKNNDDKTDESLEYDSSDHDTHYTASASYELYRTIRDKAIEVGLTISSNLNTYKDYTKRTNSVFKSNTALNHFSKKRNKLKEIKQWIFMMLEKPTGQLAFIHHLFTFSIILLTILFAAFTTMDPIKEWSENILFHIELFVIVYFFLEYCLRLWSSGCNKKYENFKGKLKFIIRPIMIIELLVVLFGALLIIGSVHIRTLDEEDKNNQKRIHFGPIALSLLSLLQLVRLLYVDRKASTWLILFDVCYKHKFELISSIYIGFITLLLSSYLIFHCEKSVPNSLFRTYSDAVYWSIITMTTIGYGDISPKTFYGKMIATALCVLGVAFWTLPGGIIGSGFAFKIEQRKQIKKLKRLLPAAAAHIQTWWRMKVALDVPTENTTRLVAVLKVFHPKKNSEKTDKSFLDNLDFRNREDDDEREKMLQEALEKQESENLNFICKKLRPKTLILIRTILILKYFVAQSKFKTAHKPYDFKDAIEQYSKDNTDILSKIKDLNKKIDSLQSNSITTGSLNNIYQKPSMDRRNSIFQTERRGSILQNANFSVPKSLQNRRVSAVNSNDLKLFNQTDQKPNHELENRIEALENKIDELIKTLNNTKNNNENLE